MCPLIYKIPCEAIINAVLVETSTGRITELSNALLLTRQAGDDGIFDTISDITSKCWTCHAPLKFR